MTLDLGKGNLSYRAPCKTLKSTDKIMWDIENPRGRNEPTGCKGTTEKSNSISQETYTSLSQLRSSQILDHNSESNLAINSDKSFGDKESSYYVSLACYSLDPSHIPAEGSAREGEGEHKTDKQQERRAASPQSRADPQGLPVPRQSQGRRAGAFCSE